MSTCKLVKKSAGKLAAPLAKAKVGDTATDFTLLDNEDNTYTVHGHSKAGNPVDISGVATLTATSDNPAIITADPPTGMTGTVHAVAPTGTANLILTATWGDGSVGPFTITVPGTVKGSAAAGLGVDFGTPTVH